MSVGKRSAYFPYYMITVSLTTYFDILYILTHFMHFFRLNSVHWCSYEREVIQMFEQKITKLQQVSDEKLEILSVEESDWGFEHVRSLRKVHNGKMFLEIT